MPSVFLWPELRLGTPLAAQKQEILGWLEKRVVLTPYPGSSGWNWVGSQVAPGNQSGRQSSKSATFARNGLLGPTMSFRTHFPWRRGPLSPSSVKGCGSWIRGRGGGSRAGPRLLGGNRLQAGWTPTSGVRVPSGVSDARPATKTFANSFVKLFIGQRKKNVFALGLKK